LLLVEFSFDNFAGRPSYTRPLLDCGIVLGLLRVEGESTPSSQGTRLCRSDARCHRLQQ
jgi:hypothetical protein